MSDQEELKFINQKLDHLHGMAHVQAEAMVAQGQLLAHVATAVDKLTPGVDPDLVAALAESKVKHDALKAALAAQMPAPPAS